MSAAFPPTLLVTGPTCAGKSTLVASVAARLPACRRVVACTTRPPRAGETPGVDYHFLTPDAFRALAAAGAFVEWQRAYGGQRYGVRWADVAARVPLQIAVVHPEGVARYRALGVPLRVVRVDAPLAVLSARVARSPAHRGRLPLLEAERRACDTLRADLVVSGVGCPHRAAAAVAALALRRWPFLDTLFSPQPHPSCP